MGSAGAELHGQGRGWDVIPRPAGSSRRLLSMGVMGSEIHFRKDFSSFWVENERTSGSGGQWLTTSAFTCWMRMAGWGTMMMEEEEVGRFDIFSEVELDRAGIAFGDGR